MPQTNRSSSPDAKAGSAAAPANPDGPGFVHLRVHSAYSLLEGALPNAKLVNLALDHQFPAVAITDTNNLFGALEFSEKMAAAGLQPIVGVTIALDFEQRGDTHAALMAHGSNGKSQANPNTALDPACDGYIALLAASERGYANLMKLVSHAHLGIADGDPPHITMSLLKKLGKGLIVLTGGPSGPLDREFANNQAQTARARLDILHKTFGDRLYIELQRHGARTEAIVEPQLLQEAYTRKIPIVATNQAMFDKPEDYEAHDALICIAQGRYVVEDDRQRMTPEHHFKSAAQMAHTFPDLPEALANTVEIAKRCTYRPMGRAPILPRFVKASKNASDEEVLKAEALELEQQARQGLKARLKAQPLAPGTSREDYDKRLTYELEIITGMKFPGYFLIVADFIKWAKVQSIPVGPGRGSGAGSLVAWALTITDLDPLRFGLLFERFLNPERVSMPDFDIDFCQDRREEVIRYVQDKYGHDRVAQIITHGKLQARAVLRDVGRVLQMPYGQVDALCKMVPNNPANPVTLSEAIETEPKLQEARDREPIVAHLLTISQKLEGLYRHASTHAAGIVIGDRPLDELVPLYRDPKSTTPVTQYNWKLVEAAGLVKFDFLGLKTLTVLQKAVEMVERRRGITIDLASVPLDDERTFKLLAIADTVGVFQLESTGMRDSLSRLRPDRFEDIIAMVALYRPGPMDNIPTYINRKHGEEPVDYLHPMLEGVLAETYGVIIYQEQVIKIAQIMGGYTLGQADLLRRAMGKKDKLEMARQQARFVEGAIEREVSAKDATYIFKLVDKFAGYGFNKSHAAAYALVSYHTAYMKANYREEFLAASMTLDLANTDKLAVFAGDAKRSGIKTAPPNVNASGVEFQAEGDPDKPGAIRYALSALKNMGISAARSIVDAREADGAFKSIGDFATRLNAKAMNKRAIETLAQAGAFDTLEPNRATVNANADRIIAMAQRVGADAAAGISDLFGGDDAAGPALELRVERAWTPLERLEKEFSAVGFFLSGHPLDQYEKALEKLNVATYTDFEEATKQGATAARLAAIVVAARERRSAKGNKYAFAMFSDSTSQFEAVVFSETLARAGDLLEPGTPVLVSVEAERDGETVKMRVQGIESLDKVTASLQSGLQIIISRSANATKAYDEIKGYLKPPRKGINGGAIRLVIQLPNHARQIAIDLNGKYDISPDVTGALSTLSNIIEIKEF